MRKFAIALAALGIAAVVTGIGLAQNDSEFQELMKSTAGAVKQLNSEVTAKNGQAASGKAKEVEANFKKMEAFWSDREKDDAVEWAQDAQASAADIAESASGGDFEAAAASLKELGATCGSCHKVHREKLPDGGFKIK